MRAELVKDLAMELGEGPLWDGNQLWFFDILGRFLYRLSPQTGTLESWEGERYASAIARTTGPAMLVATESDLMLFDPAAETMESLIDLEADRPGTRSNDGRADRQGGFWIGTMGKAGEPGAGAIYRYYKGELRKLREQVTIPNSICFSPDGKTGYFSDSWAQTIYRTALDAEGWPEGEAEVFYRVEGGDAGPDGAVVDAEGMLWVAMWGEGQVMRISAEGKPVAQVSLPVSQPSCPALTEAGRLFITSARQGLEPGELMQEPHAGGLFAADVGVPGLPEPRVIL